MGGKYSKVVNPYFRALKVLEGMTLAEIKAKMAEIAKAKQKTGIYFLSKNDIAWALSKLNEIQLYQIITLFDVSENGNISSLDFWGALGMLSEDSNDDKINFCFRMMDLNNDDHLSYNDLVIAMNCVTRGVAKMRGYAVMPQEYLDKMALEAFRVCKKVLNEHGEISSLDFRVVLLSDDLVGQYMASLGVPVVEVDAAALVTKRSNLLREAMALRAKISETLCAIEECGEEEEQKANERGGDVELLRITAEEVAESRQKHALAIAAEHRRKLREKGLAIEDSKEGGSTAVVTFAMPNDVTLARNVRTPNKSAITTVPNKTAGAGQLQSRPVAADPEHPSRKYLKCDNSVFADADMTSDRKAAKSMYGDGFRAALLEVWMKLPQDEDLMSELDAYTIIALFDNVTVTLSFEAAQHCLNYLPRSAINRYRFDDVLRWFLLYGSDMAAKDEHVVNSSALAVRKPGSSAGAEEPPTKPVGAAWHAFTEQCWQAYTSAGVRLSEVLTKAAYLRSVLDRVDQLVPNRTLKYPNYLHPTRAAVAATPSSGSRPTAQSGAKEMGYMMKLVEFRKLTSKKPSNIQLKYIFNHPNVKVLPMTFGADPNSSGPGGARSPSRERGRPTSRGRSSAAKPNSRSRSRGKSKSPDSRPGSREQDAGTGASPATKSNTAANTSTNKPGSAGLAHDRYVSDAERLPPTKTIKVEEIEDWKFNFKLSFTASPFTNLSTKRPKDSSRIRSANGRNYIDDFSNLQAQDLLDYYNLLQEKLLIEQIQQEAEAQAAALTATASDESAAGRSAWSGSLGGAKKQAKKEAVVYNTVSWCCLQLKANLQPEQEALFAAAVRNFFLAVPYDVRETLYSEVFTKVFTVFKADGASVARAADKVAGKFLSSLTGKGDDSAEADAVFLAAPKVLLVALFHETDHFTEIEKQLLSSDVFLTRALSSATLDMQFMQTFAELMERADQYVLYGERLFGPQEEDMGADNMNPIKFAKEIRAKRRKYEELAQGAGKMNRAELVQHCKEMGLKDSGTMAELVRRAREGFELAADLAGYGELSKFGENVVTKIFHMFKVHPIAKSDEDGGLTLWEFNKLLHHVGAPALYDTAEYTRLMKELQLLVDRDQRLRLHGLQAYYRSSGRLKAENDRLGVGSLDEHVSGRFFFSSTFEPDALASIFNLLGSNALFIPELVKRLTAWSTVKDVKMDAELDKLSEFFSLFDLDIGKKINREVLRSPGWLSRAWNTFSAFLSDGEEGILPAVRTFVTANFAGRYSDWDNTFQGSFLEELQGARDGDERLRDLRALWAVQDRRLARKAQREEEAALFLLRQQQINDAGSVGSHSTANRAPFQVSQLSGSERGTDNGSLKASPRGSVTGGFGPGGLEGLDGLPDDVEGEGGDLEEEEEEGEFEVVDYATQVEARLQEILQAAIAATLPPAECRDINIPATILQLKEDLIFLFRIRGTPGLELTLEESSAIFDRKELLVKKIAEAQEMAESNNKLLAAHTCAAYDAIRLFTVGLSSIGAGSRDCCVRGYADGLDIAEYLPRGIGELAPVKQRYVEKVERARQRKASALAALERERRRRNMTEEEKEEMRREQLAAQLLAWAKEEAQMFARAYSALSNAREERKSTAEITEMVGLWEALVTAKETRYPTEAVTAVCQNALACIVLEFFGSRHPRGARKRFERVHISLCT
jgi:Ca2+-binding EF-hand superfamily protein